MGVPSEEALHEFTAAFGRHSTLIAQALHYGGHIDQIKKQAAVVEARERVNEAIARCGGKAALRLPRVLDGARDVKRAVEEEWGVSIPMTTEVSE